MIGNDSALRRDREIQTKQENLDQAKKELGGWAAKTPLKSHPKSTSQTSDRIGIDLNTRVLLPKTNVFSRLRLLFLRLTMD